MIRVSKPLAVVFFFEAALGGCVLSGSQPERNCSYDYPTERPLDAK